MTNDRGSTARGPLETSTATILEAFLSRLSIVSLVLSYPFVKGVDAPAFVAVFLPFTNSQFALCCVAQLLLNMHQTRSIN
jgi:hypothetical protein